VTQVRSYGRAGLLDLDLGQRAVEAVDDERHLVSELELLKLGHAIVADTNTGRLRTTKERKAKKKIIFFPSSSKKRSPVRTRFVCAGRDAATGSNRRHTTSSPCRTPTRTHHSSEKLKAFPFF
jgi:hypothetical protein